MVAVVKVDKNGHLVEIREVSDMYRYKPYEWNKD